MNRVDYRLFTIKPSRVISSLCYSIFKLEPYSECIYNCIYCYSKWYRGFYKLDPSILIKIWLRNANRLSKLVYKPYFRLSTLTDPLQENIENKQMISYYLMRIACKYNIPLIINTKSPLVVEEPWINLLEEMSINNQVLVQISISTTDKYCELFEEKIIPSSARISIVRKLVEKEIPVVIRLQPVIPGFEDDHINLLEELIDSGIRGVITEPIRVSLFELKYISSVLKTDLDSYIDKYCWRKYTFESFDLWVPSDEWWFSVLNCFREIIRNKFPLTICKYKPVEPGVTDCCLFYTTGCKTYGVRETIREIVFKQRSSIHVFSINEYVLFPKLIRRGLKQHFNKLLKTINDKLFIEEYIGLETT